MNGNKRKFKVKDRPKSRKEIRKEKRHEKKAKRASRYQRKFQSNKEVLSEEEVSKNLQHTRDTEGEKLQDLKEKPKKKSKVKSAKADPLGNERIKIENEYSKLELEMKEQRKRQLIEDNENEDRVIKTLEKKLNLHKRKRKTLAESFRNDGLDYLLELCDTNLSDEAQNESVKRLQLSKATNVADKTHTDFSDNECEQDLLGDDGECDISDYSESGPSEDEDDNNEGSGSEENVAQEEQYHEDIYGRLRDKKGNIIEEKSGKYVPPHLKNELLKEADDSSSEHLQNLSKQLKGFLNRLTESNMHSISHQVEDLYMSYSHNDVNLTLKRLLKNSLVMTVNSPEQILVNCAFLVSILHANVGTEVGADILESFVREFVQQFDQKVKVENKEMDNLLHFIAQLYNFKVSDSCIVFDILEKLVDRFQEKDIELILLVLRTVGVTLRKDNPLALKNLIFKLQSKANESPELQESSRVRFMLDTVLAIKNNNVSKIPQYDPSYVEHLKKIMKPILRPGKFISTLKITLEDILNADKCGRWWIVGSAWKNDSRFKSEKESSGNKVAEDSEFSQDMLKLARKQGMNTDIRKSIFCILMTAEDYMDAFEKLMKLGLKGPQHREIVHVLVHCFLKEKQYNPYYVFLAEHLCSVDRIYQLALQFAMWDRFKEIQSLSSMQIANVAKFLSYLLLENKISLSVLKVLQFAEMDKSMVKLIKGVLLSLLSCEQSQEKITQVFSRISKSAKLATLRQSLQLFLHHFVLKKNADNDNIKVSELEKKVKLAEKAMFKYTADIVS